MGTLVSRQVHGSITFIVPPWPSGISFCISLYVLNLQLVSHSCIEIDFSGTSFWSSGHNVPFPSLYHAYSSLCGEKTPGGGGGGDAREEQAAV